MQNDHGLSDKVQTINMYMLDQSKSCNYNQIIHKQKYNFLKSHYLIRLRILGTGKY